jgi:hypothetical protein
MPYYIPLVMVPVITCMMVCCFLKKLSFLNCVACKKVAQSERMQNITNAEWIHRKSSFAFVPMQLWDGNNEEIRIEEMASMLQKKPELNSMVCQRKGNGQLTGPCDSDLEKSDIEIINTVPCSDLYDNVVQELKELNTNQDLSFKKL